MNELCLNLNAIYVYIVKLCMQSIYKNYKTIHLNMSNYKKTKQKQTTSSFKHGSLDEILKTATPRAHELINIKLHEIFSYDP